mmetsp:Transcript_6122/g.20865  ORF Transcript_6122/g.20865 Transcript_6122/m.20865 type:complete len:104 (-) Transcript_6122:23-334(-)
MRIDTPSRNGDASGCLGRLAPMRAILAALSVAGAGAAAPPAPAYGGQQAAQRPMASGSLMRVVVPANAGPGSTLTVNVPGKGPHRIVVPAGCAPGQSFQFRVQ